MALTAPKIAQAGPDATAHLGKRCAFVAGGGGVEIEREKKTLMEFRNG
jgi:hypothetical protein